MAIVEAQYQLLSTVCSKFRKVIIDLDRNNASNLDFQDMVCGGIRLHVQNRYKISLAQKTNKPGLLPGLILGGAGLPQKWTFFIQKVNFLNLPFTLLQKPHSRSIMWLKVVKLADFGWCIAPLWQTMG